MVAGRVSRGTVVISSSRLDLLLIAPCRLLFAKDDVAPPRTDLTYGTFRGAGGHGPAGWMMTVQLV